jgi:hypothetical protein
LLENIIGGIRAMLKKLLNIKVPTLFDDHQQGTVKTEWQAYLFIVFLLVMPVLLVIAYLNYWI